MLITKIVDLYDPEGDFERTLYENRIKNDTLTKTERERFIEKLSGFEWVREKYVRRVLVEHQWWDNNRTVVSETHIFF